MTRDGAATSSPGARGAAAGLAAAALFGLSAPLGKHLVATIDPQLLAGLLYAGAAIGFWVVRAARRSRAREAPLRRADAPSVAAIALLGGAVGPVLLLIGLAKVSGVTGALLLNLEAPATIAIATLFFREHLGRRLAVAAALIVAGGAILGWRSGEIDADPLGAAAIALACCAWGVDNNLTQRLSLKDPFAIVRIKATSAALANVAIATLRGATWPAAGTLAAVLVVGFCSYGVSVLLDAYALRAVGAAREAAYFATAPFLGAAAAMVLFAELPGLAQGGAMFAMALGVVLLLRERHAHHHVHEAMEHEHAHVHDEHHQHPHRPGDPEGEPHVHPHRHEPIAHDHPHLPDLHHRHRH
jgi:drug/metabolite transporter (DMT)-like permease